MRSMRFPAACLALIALAGFDVRASAAGPVDGDHWFETLEWRCIGPSRGGRSVAAAGVRGDRLTYYMGGCGGGVWKTTNAGVSWQPVSDGFIGTGSVGAIAVADSDPNVVYVGMGEACVRGNFSHGDGVYRSVDAGKTWTHLGLEDTRQIGDVVVHPDDPDVVYVAALGHVFGPNAQRGVFRSTDGGATWQRVLFVDERTGAVDLAMDPNNPRVLFAGFWQVRRTPWSLESGGEGSGLYRSTDGGDTWELLTEGLPRGIKGRIGVTVSGARRDRVWAIVEAEDGGVFRSEDGGDTWRRVNEDRNLRQRAWYYTHITADPHEPDTVYVMNVRFHKSIDGGRTYSTIRVPHGDNHGLWIDPDDNLRMINANDGGANVSFDGGATWSRQDMQPTAQFYHVDTDAGVPYRVYGAQQDNSTVSVSSRNRIGGRRDDFYPVGGGESGYVVPHPADPGVVYAGSYGGYLTRYDHRLRKTRNITVWPENPMGAGAADLVHRFQWTFPIVISPHDHDVLYVGGEVLFRSTDEGQSWSIVSPDLTTDDESKQASSGGPITKDNTSVEYYCTIFTVAESPLRAGTIWVGTDDGRVHLTTDGAETWTEVTPPGMGDWPLVSMVDASPHDAETAWLAVNRYKMDDFRPYVYRTTDAGRTWQMVAGGIDGDAFVRVVREDPVRPGLLYAGTETGVWVSFDHGDHWQSLQRDLPAVPVTDLVVHGDDLVISTQGRSFWILEGLSLLRQLDDGADAGAAHLFTPAPSYRQRWDSATIRFHLPEGLDEPVRLELLDGHSAIRTYAVGLEGAGGSQETDDDAERLSARPGINALRWNGRHPDPPDVPGVAGWPGTPPGPRVAPGTYRVRLTVGESVHEQPMETTAEEYAAQVELLMAIHEAVTEAHDAVNRIRAIRGQVDDVVRRARQADLGDPIAEPARELNAALTAVEEQIIQTRSVSAQDPLNYPVKLNDKLGALVGAVDGDYGPTAQTQGVYRRLRELLDAELATLKTLLEEDVQAFNDLVHEQRVPAVIVPGGGS
ncbi:MAG: WD40/YVTN/BNR-like repeat-containing protein [Planctomycetota bacterium]